MRTREPEAPSARGTAAADLFARHVPPKLDRGPLMIEN
jgi:hypothetical protein